MKSLALALFTFLGFSLLSQNVGIGTETPHSSAALDISDTNRGLLIPRADTLDIANPAIGLLIYQLSDNGFYSFNGLQWKLIGKLSDKIEDEDKDTRIEVEQNPDEDKIRFFTNGTEVLRQNGSTLETPNSGHSVFIGEEAGLNDDLTDNNNVFVGYRAGKENSTGLNNVAIGEQSLQNSTAGNNNVAIGKQSLSLNSGSNNIGIGLNALQKNTSGQKNTALGGFAGFANQAGNENTLIGYEAGRGGAGDVTGNVMIGHQAGKNEDASNKLYVANTDTDFPLIYGDFANNTLKIHDTLEVSDQISVGSPTGTQQESAELAGAIQIGNAATDTPSINDAGTLRWNGNASDYQGWDGEKWLSMTNPNEEIDCEIGTEIDTLPFIISESGFYYVQKNLQMVVTGQPGVQVLASDVTIDLNGFSIIGPGNSGSVETGIAITSPRASVRNGTIKDWPHNGIEVGTSGISASFNNLFITFCGTGIKSVGTDLMIDHCQSNSNTSHGFDLGNQSIINYCISNKNGGSGFTVNNNNSLNNCISNFNDSHAFEVFNYNKVKNCIARNSDLNGIKANDSNSIEGCSISSSFDSGIDARNNNSIHNNNLELNNTLILISSGGIKVNRRNRLSQNLLSSNIGTGIYINSIGNMLIDNDVFQTIFGTDTKAYRFLSSSNAWSGNTAEGTEGGTTNNVTTIQPPSSRSLNNWLY